MAGVIGGSQLFFQLLFIAYLVALVAVAITKCIKKKTEDCLEEQLQDMEMHLASRKKKSAKERKRKSSRTAADDQ